MEKLKAPTASFDHRTDLVERIVHNMSAQHQNATNTGILLSGDPGVGKTSFMHFFAKLIGVELIVIEAPHITEEHVINIPFIVVNPSTGAQTSASFGVDDTDYKIVLSKSNLLSLLQKAAKTPDAKYLKDIYKSSSDVIAVFENLGGSEKVIPEEIQDIRAQCNSILFLDEYFRQSSVRIKNILRGILNKKIGLDDLPADVYVIFASNLRDTGGSVENIPTNQQFDEVEFGTPNKEDWFSYLSSKFEKDDKVKLNKKLMDKFYETLDEEHLNFHDMANNVRTSPRRWEQLLLYINSSLPAENKEDAMSLLTNVKLNFKDYLTGSHSDLAHKVIEATIDLIKETSGIELGATDVHEDEDWRKTLEHQIKQKMKLGKHRKYVPVVSGMPGVGKTSHAYQIAKDLGLGLIYIDCSTLEPEDVTGIPLSKTKGKDIETHFSEPKLYNIIKKEADKYAHLKGTNGFKYLVMFDEMNRASVKVFNGIRRVLLEGKFSDGLEMPEGSVMISAINPKDSGTAELTDHVKDVVDVIDSGSSWASVVKYMNGTKLKQVSPQVEESVMSVIDIFNKKFHIKKSKEIKTSQLPFYLNVGSEDVYMAPREYTHLYSSAAIAMASAVKKVKAKQEEYDEKPDELNEFLRTAMYKAFNQTLSFIFKKQDAESPKFDADLKTWFLNSPDLTGPIDELFTVKKNKAADFVDIAGHFFNNPKEKITKDVEFVNYLNSVDAAVFKEDFLAFLQKEIKHEKDVLDHILGKSLKRDHKDAAGNEVKLELSKFEHFIYEVAEACERHKMSYDKIEMIKEVVLSFLTEKLSDDNMAEMMEISKGLNKIVKSLIKK